MCIRPQIPQKPVSINIVNDSSIVKTYLTFVHIRWYCLCYFWRCLIFFVIYIFSYMSSEGLFTQPWINHVFSFIIIIKMTKLFISTFLIHTNVVFSEFFHMIHSGFFVGALLRRSLIFLFFAKCVVMFNMNDTFYHS